MSHEQDLHDTTLNDWRNTIAQYDLLTARQERDLAVLVAQGDEQATHQFVLANLRLVASIAKRYVKEGVPLIDLIQEGNAALIHAARKFDVDKGWRFSTYATYWVHQACGRMLASDYRMISLPVHLSDVARKVHGIAEQLAFELGHEPTDQQIADAANVVGIRRSGKLITVTEALVVEWRYILQHPLSLDGFVIMMEDDDDLGLDLEDRNAIVPGETNIELANMQDMVERALNVLPLQSWKRVITLRYGLDRDGEWRTQREVAKEMGLNHQRVQQIEVRALSKMRTFLDRERLREAS